MVVANMHNKEDVKKRESVDLHTLYPVVVDSPETSVTFDTDSIDTEKLSGQFNISQQALSPGSTVHIEHSSDVVVGSLTQFHGPVTIYQNINSQKDGKIVTNGVATDLNTKYKSPARYQNISKRLVIPTSIVFVTLAIIGITLSTISTATSEDNVDVSTPSEFPENYKMYTKSEWGGRPSLNHTRPLTHPTEYVLISHTASQFCETFATCSTKMQQMQSQHVSEFNSPDIGYNFVIGGDAGIYVGRGWDIRNFHTDRNIGISFIGNFVYDYLTVEMIEALKEVLELGVKLDKLWANYKLICHNQTSNTLSPGEHVYMEISKLPHFYDGVITI